MKIEDISPKIYDERQLKAVRGLGVDQFYKVLSVFDRFITEEK